jgi:hypothetical protein
MPRNPLLNRPSTPEDAPVNIWHRLGLERNPFPDRPGVTPGSLDPRSNGSIYVESIRRAQQGRFDDLLIPKPNHSTRCMAFLMDTATRHGRGIGKTSFLHHQRQRVMTDVASTLTEGHYALFAAHILPTGGTDTRKFWQFARLVITAFNDQEIVARTAWRLRAFSGRIPEPVLEQAQDLPATIGDDAWLIRQGVDVERDLNVAVQEQLTRNGVGPDIAERIARHAHSPERFRAEVLRPTTDYRWRQIAATWLTNDLVVAFRLAGFHRGLLLVDDFEKVVRGQNLVERRTFVDDVRYAFIDGPTRAAETHFFSILWVIYPYIQELLLPHWNAAGLGRFAALEEDRAADYRIDFPPLDIEATDALVREYIARARRQGEDHSPLSPLQRPALETAYRLTRGLPGHLLSWLHLAFERAAREEWPAIDNERVAALAQAHPPMFPDDAPEAPQLAPPAVDLRAEE